MFFRVFYSILFSLLLTVNLSAQETEESSDEGPTIPEMPDLPGDEEETELVTESEETDGDEEEEVLPRIVFRDDSLGQVLIFLERLTGRSIIRPQQLPTPTISFDSQRPLTVDEAILALESLLSINGITVVPLGEYFLKVIPAGQTQQHGPELLLESALDLRPSGRVATRLYRLEFLQIEEFQQRIQPILSPQIGNVIPFEKANAIMVTETVSNLQRIETIINTVDRPFETPLETRFYDIQYAQAQELAGRLNNLRQAALQRQFSSSTVVEADERTNQLIVITDPRNMDFFDRFVEEMDIETEPRTRNAVIQLKHANAVDVADLLSQLVSDQLGQSEQEQQPRAGINGEPAAGTQPDPDAQQEGEGGPDGDGDAPPEPAVENVPPQIQEIAGDMVEDVRSEFSSLLTILADERTNSLVVSGTENDLNLIESLVESIDVLLAQVFIEVVIAEVTLSEDNARGIDTFGFQYSSNGETEANTGGPGPDGRAFEFGFAGTLSDYTIDGVIGIAESKSNVDILSVPSISTTHNREARIVVGEARPIVSSQVSDTGVQGFRSNVTFRDIAIDLTVTPLIGLDGIIQLEIEQLVDNVVDQVEVGGNLQPVIGRKEATSFVSVGSGEMVVLGGLQSEELRETDRKMAFLGYIPLLGRLFSPTRMESQKTELILFIRPTVLPNIQDAHRDARERRDGFTQRDGVGDFIRNELETARQPETERRLVPAQRSPRIYD